MKENIVTDATNPIQNDDKCYQLMLCNSIGTTVDCKYITYILTTVKSQT